MAYTLVEVQARIVRLKATYDELTDRYVKSYSIADRDTTYQDMAMIRTELDHWTAMETSLGGNMNSAIGVAYASFSDPR